MMIFIVTYNIVIILLSVAVAATAAYDIVVEINIIVIDRIVEV